MPTREQVNLDSPQTLLNKTVSTALVTTAGTATPRALSERFVSWLDVKDEAAAGNGIADDRQAFVDADVDTTGSIVVSDGTYRIGSNLTLVSQVLFRGGVMKPDAGVSITFSGGVSASPTSQIFDTTASATSYAVIRNQIVSPCWWGVTVSGSVDSLAAWNQVVKHLNGNKIEQIQCPPGSIEFSAEPNAILEGPLTIEGAGGASTILIMQAGAGTASRFLTLGDATHSVGRASIHDFSLQYNNFSSLVGASPGFDLIRTVDVTIYNIINGRENGSGAGGFIKLGDNALQTTASRTKLRRVETLMYGPSEGTVFDVQLANGLRVSDSTNTIGVPSVTGALRGLHIHPEGGAVTVDSSIYQGVEWNFPGDNVDTIIDIDATQGIIVNQWFTDCVADHSLASNVKIHIDAGAHASARMNNIFFTELRSYSDGGGALVIDNTGNRDMFNIIFVGGVLSGFDAAAVRMVGSGARKDVGFIGVNFTDEHLTAKAVIDAQGLFSFRVVGCSVGPQLSTQTCGYTYLVNFLADVTDFNISSNNAKSCSLGLIESTALSLGQADKRIVANNSAPSIDFTQHVTTTDATVTTLMNIPILDARVCHITLVAAGVKSDGTDRASYEITGTFYRTAAGTVTQQGATTVVHTAESNAAWNFAFTVAGSTIQGKVTGAVGAEIRWGGNVKHCWMQAELG